MKHQMKKLLFLLIALSTMSLNAQNKGYVYKPSPSEYVSAKQLNLSKVSVQIEDVRILHPKTKVSCKFSDIQTAIIQSLNNAFKETTFTTGKEDATITIKLNKYETFERGVVWIAITEYEIQFNGSNTIINGTHSEGNIWGKATGKKILKKSFDKANLDLINWLINPT